MQSSIITHQYLKILIMNIFKLLIKLTLLSPTANLFNLAFNETKLITYNFNPYKPKF